MILKNSILIILISSAFSATAANKALPNLKFKSDALQIAYEKLNSEFPGAKSIAGQTDNGRDCIFTWNANKKLASYPGNTTLPISHVVSIEISDTNNSPEQRVDHNVDSMRWSEENGKQVLRSVDYTLEESGRTRIIYVLRNTKNQGQIRKVELYEKKVNYDRGKVGYIRAATCNLQN